MIDLDVSKIFPEREDAVREGSAQLGSAVRAHGLFPPAPPENRGWSAVSVARLFAPGALAGAVTSPRDDVNGAGSRGKGARSRRRRISPRSWAAIVGVVLVAAVAAGAVTFAVGAQRASTSAIRAAETELASDEQDARVRGSALSADISDFSVHVESERSAAAALAGPLARMAGASDENARVSAELARTTYLAFLDGLGSTRAPDDLTGSQPQAASMADIDAARRELDAYKAQLDVVESSLGDLTDTQGAAEVQFHNALTAFVQSLPGFAAELASANADADEYFRTTMKQSADAVAAAVPSASTGTASWDTYVVAVNALRTDQLRAVDEKSSNSSDEQDAARSTQSTESSTSTANTSQTQDATPTPTSTATATVEDPEQTDSSTLAG